MHIFSLCYNCFHNGNHKGHDINMFRTIAGGTCDCGNISVMNLSGNCKYHGSNRIPNASIPHRFIRCAQIILPRLVFRLIQHLRSHATPISKCILNYEIYTLSFLFRI